MRIKIICNSTNIMWIKYDKIRRKILVLNLTSDRDENKKKSSHRQNYNVKMQRQLKQITWKSNGIAIASSKCYVVEDENSLKCMQMTVPNLCLAYTLGFVCLLSSSSAAIKSIFYTFIVERKYAMKEREKQRFYFQQILLYTYTALVNFLLCHSNGVLFVLSNVNRMATAATSLAVSQTPVCSNSTEHPHTSTDNSICEKK